MEELALLELLEEAKKAALNAYSPYSGYKVGAALLGKSGKVYTGCNVENASYSLTICAERNAVFNAVNQAEREYRAIAIWVEANQSFPPCGACRQVLYEFSPHMVLIWGSYGGHQMSTLDKLLPGAFVLEPSKDN